MSLGWPGRSIYDEPAPTPIDLKRAARQAVVLHSGSDRRWCCRTDPCEQLTWARGHLGVDEQAVP